MKVRISTLFVIISFALLTACNNDDDNSPEIEAIAGTWNLKNVSGGFAGIDIDYTQGEVKWTFIQTNHTLLVENNIITDGPQANYAGLESGTYTYEIQEVDTIETLYINTDKRGIIIILDDNLKIDDGLTADGFLTEFER